MKFPVITGNLCLDEDYIMMKILWIIICICVSCHIWQNIDSECDLNVIFFSSFLSNVKTSVKMPPRSRSQIEKIQKGSLSHCIATV